MENTTVLFRLRYTVAFSQEGLTWLNNFRGEWFSKEDGDLFLQEFGGTWWRIFESVVNDELQTHLKQLNLPDNFLPFIQRGETHRGSWVMEASIVMSGTMGSAYNAVSLASSDLSKVGEGFVGRKDEIIRKLEIQTNEEVARTLARAASNVQTPVPRLPPPTRAAVLDLAIDAEPLKGLLDPAAESSEAQAQEEDSVDRVGKTSLDQLLERYSKGLSMLSRSILDLAGQFASTREHNHDQLTSSCILFAAVELGAQPPHLKIDNASQFLFQWLHEDQRRSSSYKQAISEFLRPANSEGKPGLIIPTSHATRIIETAARMAIFVRKETITSERGKINARDLVGALLYIMSINSRLGAARRLAAMDVSLDALRTDYFNDFLNHEKNPDDYIENWRKVLIDLTLPNEERPLIVLREAKPSLPNIDADTPSVKVDLLNITPEVEGFAKIIAARDVKTPLSIGLFGDWGSGKSSFMEQLQATVEKIAKGVREKKKGEETSFLGNIVQIKFNAWHYAEANLWASLVSHVFENLSFSETEEKEKAQERKKLFLGRLVTGLAAQKAAEADVKEKEAKYEDAKSVLNGVKQEQIEARLERREVVINGVWPIVREFLSGNDEAQRQLDAAGDLLGKAGLTEEGLKREIEESRTMVRRAQWYLSEIKKDPWRWWYGALILILMLVMPIVLTFVLTKLGTGQFWARMAEILAALVPPLAWLGSKRGEVGKVLNTLERANSQLDAMYKNARKTYDERLSLLKEQLAAKETQVNNARKLVDGAKIEVAETITTLREMEPARLLQTFVQERASSEDYRKLLGVIALIRRDFKKLSDLLGDQDQTELRQAVSEILKEEARKKEEEEQKTQESLVSGGVAAAGGEGVSSSNGGALSGNAGNTGKEPSMEMVDERLKDFRIERIVLYIDDLDRCPPKQVVDVLQAIHLLLAFELFVVVVGVDARWIRHALRERYPEMLSEDWDDVATPKSGEERLVKMATPRDYVEKIFQVPFWLKPMDDAAAQKLFEGLIPVSQLSPAVKNDDSLPADESQADAGLAKGKVAMTSSDFSGVAGEDSIGARPSLETFEALDQATQPNQTMAASSSAGPHVEEFELVLKPDSLLLDINERNAMVALSRVIGKTPRTLKRFVNVYRIIKAGLSGQELEAFVGTGPSDAQYRAVLVLLAVAYGGPDAAPAFFRALKNNRGKDEGLKKFLLTDTPPSKMSSSFFQPEFEPLLNLLREYVTDYDVDMPLAVLLEWLPVVVRYTFQLGRLSEEVANRKARVVQWRKRE